MSAINLNDLNAALTERFQADKGPLIRKMLLEMDLGPFVVMDGVKDEQPLPKVSTTELVRPAIPGGGFSPKTDAIKFGARKLKTRPWQVDLLLDANQFLKTWMAGYVNPRSRLYQIPWEQAIFNHIIMQIHNDIRMKGIHRGVYNAAGSNAIDVVDGLLTIISNEITATNITPVVTGAINPGNVSDSLHTVYDSLGEAQKASPIQILVSSSVFDMYARLFNPLNNASIVTNDIKGMRGEPRLNQIGLHGTNATVKREPGFGVSQRIVATTENNLYYGTNTLGEENMWEFQRFNRTTKIMVDGTFGVEIADLDPDVIAVNDQA